MSFTSQKCVHRFFILIATLHYISWRISLKIPGQVFPADYFLGTRIWCDLGALVYSALKNWALLVKWGADTHRCSQLGAKKIGFISNQLEYGYRHLGQSTVIDYLDYLGLCRNYYFYLYKNIYLKFISTPSFK